MLADRQPELAPAANLQVDLIESVRRVQGRITTPWIETSTETLNARLTSGQPLLEFAQIAFDWNDVRLLIRQVTDVLRRHEVIDAAGAAALHAVGRGPTLPDVMRGWFEQQPALEIDMLDEVLGWAARPYLQRTAEVLQQRVSLDRWGRRMCPVCAAEPEFSVITMNGDRQLVCGRCHVRWGSMRSPARIAATTTAPASSRWPRPTASTAWRSARRADATSRRSTRAKRRVRYCPMLT